MPSRIIRQPATVARSARAGSARVALGLGVVVVCASGCSLVLDIPPKRHAQGTPDGGPVEPPRGADAASDVGAPPIPGEAAPKDAGSRPDARTVQDAAPAIDASPADAGCMGPPVTWYADDDRDGYGRSGTSGDVRLSCARPGAAWATVSGDCADDNALVHPGQVTYFGAAYQRTDGSSSFDYDCSNTEEGDLTIPLSPKNCGLLSLALCGGMGYAATSREGPFLNPYCGSGVWSTCEAKGLGLLVCESTSTRRDPPYGCR